MYYYNFFVLYITGFSNSIVNEVEKMIKENQKYFNGMQVLLDAIVMCISFFTAYLIRFESGLWPEIGYHPPFYPQIVFTAGYANLIPFLAVFYAFLYFYCRLYSPRRYRSRRFELFNIIKANTVGIICLILILFLTSTNTIRFPVWLMSKYFSRWMLFFFYIINIILTYLERDLVRIWLRKTRKNGRNLKHVIIVGFSSSASAYIDRLIGNPQWGYKIHGILDDNVTDDFSYRKIPWIGRISDLASYLDEHSIDEVAITLSIKEYIKLQDLVKACEKSGVHTKFVPDYYTFISSNPYTEDLNGLPVINIRNVPLTNTVNKTLKRVMDIVGSLAAILLFSPVMLITAILVKKSSPGPIIFKQIRIGYGGKEFDMFKFRSMGVQLPGKEKTEWTTSNDPRVTPIGKIIRKTSIDELPQLFNVLRGDMSLVGPRPERPYFVEKFKEEIPRYMIKHQVRPGITGWAQVNGYRGDTSIKGRIDHDLYYIENWTLGLDIKILFLTVFKGFVNENAY